MKKFINKKEYNYLRSELSKGEENVLFRDKTITFISAYELCKRYEIRKGNQIFDEWLKRETRKGK